MLSAGTNERNVLMANGTVVAFIAMLGYGTGTPMGGVRHTSGKQRFIPTPWLQAGSMAASYPRWISLPLMLMVSSVTMEALFAVSWESASTMVRAWPARTFHSCRT